MRIRACMSVALAWVASQGLGVAETVSTHDGKSLLGLSRAHWVVAGLAGTYLLALLLMTVRDMRRHLATIPR